jgi:hypothetical protein
MNEIDEDEDLVNEFFKISEGKNSMKVTAAAFALLGMILEMNGLDRKESMRFISNLVEQYALKANEIPVD